MLMSCGRNIVSFYSLPCGAELLDTKLSDGVRCNVSSGSSSTNDEQRAVLALIWERFKLQQLDLLPFIVSLLLRHVSDE